MSVLEILTTANKCVLILMEVSAVLVTLDTCSTVMAELAEVRFYIITVYAHVENNII